jgi:epoxyqueuosine reductase
MNDLQNLILKAGASIVGFADITSLPKESRNNLPSGIAIGIALNPKIVTKIPQGPFMDYIDEYTNTTKKLDEISILVKNQLIDKGYNAISQTVDYVKHQRDSNSEIYALLPHKTVAALAGLGWISKSSLLITKEFGSAVRFISVLTDAPLKKTKAQYRCLCGDCQICVEACPGKSIKNKIWNINLNRDDIIDFRNCRNTVLERGKKFNKTHGACGICMAVCPYTEKYLKLTLHRA